MSSREFAIHCIHSDSVHTIIEPRQKSFLKLEIPPSLSFSKDVLLSRMEHKYLFYCSNPVVNGCSLISNPHKYRF